MFFSNNDPFDEILKEFFGERPRSRSYRNNLTKTEQDERVIDYSEDENSVYFIFELPGYNEEDVDISVKDGNIKINAVKKNSDAVQNYLNQKLTTGITLSKKLPDYVKPKKFSQEMKNGVLELKFRKK